MSRRAVASCAALLSCVLSIPGHGITPIASDPVDTTGGKLAGTLLPSGVKAYLGVRYAAPPTQDLRWRPPQPVRWDGVWVADRYGAECIQVLRPHDINHYFGEEPSGEDCLYLNMWVPPDAKPASKLPVIVFIHGGGGTIGSAGMAVYGGEAVARAGAIFVNMNYRVGALGFMAHPELTREQGGHSGNYGYLDQSAALRWVHDNVAAFGGDPSKVLITGQSFGATSVAAHIFSPLSRGLFRAAAMWSACNFSSAGPDLATAEKTGLELQRRVGASNLQKMRDVPADRILAQQAESQVGANVQGVRTPPLIDGYFTVGDKATVLATRGITAVSILVGSNSDDLDANQSPLTRARTVAEFVTIARQMYGANAEAFLRLFPVEADADVRAAASVAARENGMLKASRECARVLGKFKDAPAYVTLFTQKHPYPAGLTLADQNPESIGAYHTADVPYWFGTLDAFNLFRPTRVWRDSDRTLSAQMLQSLIAFANRGTPDTAELKWPVWSASDERYLLLAAPPRVEKLRVERIDWLAAHPAVVAEPADPRRPRD